MKLSRPVPVQLGERDGTERKGDRSSPNLIRGTATGERHGGRNGTERWEKEHPIPTYKLALLQQHGGVEHVAGCNARIRTVPWVAIQHI